jgi:LCP family protein required for cell wall assembly
VFWYRLPLALLIVISTVIGTFLLANVLIEVKLGAADRVDLSLSGDPSGGGANYLLIGSDTREFVSDQNEEDAFGTSSETGPARSDTIMVLHTDPDSDRALLVSFPRDLWVDIPGRGNAKINAAFNDGAQSVIDTLESDFDVPIQHYVEVNFASFRDIVDAIGTVPVYFPAPARDKKSGLHAPVQGCYQLDGTAALEFVRARNLEVLDPITGSWTTPDPIPDLGRIKRQQAFLREVGKRAMDSALTNPLTANDIIDGAIGRLRVDGDFGRTDVFSLADAFAAGGDGPETLTVPTEGATRDGQSVLDATSDAEALFQRLRDFDTVVPSAAPAATGDAEPVPIASVSGQEPSSLAPVPGTC